MERIAAVFAVLLFALLEAGAEEFKIGDPAWGARIQFPEQWESDNSTGMWYQGWTKDRKVWLSAITFGRLPIDWHRKWLVKHCDTFGVGITVAANQPEERDCRVGEFHAKEYRIAATWDESPVEISAFAVTLAPGRIVLFTVGGRAADRLRHKDTIARIVESLRVEPATAKPPSRE
ncbi:MAG: hypothetical protein KA004_12675 [Verrucomicrobiales bacterium]|nr:hypothetical protein [Verrucomicrobiales bacterium]